MCLKMMIGWYFWPIWKGKWWWTWLDARVFPFFFRQTPFRSIFFHDPQVSNSYFVGKIHVQKQVWVWKWWGKSKRVSRNSIQVLAIFFCQCSNFKWGHDVDKYPLVNIQKNYGKSPFLMGKSTISIGPFSIANCLFTRGYSIFRPVWGKVQLIPILQLPN